MVFNKAQYAQNKKSCQERTSLNKGWCEIITGVDTLRGIKNKTLRIIPGWNYGTYIKKEKKVNVGCCVSLCELFMR